MGVQLFSHHISVALMVSVPDVFEQNTLALNAPAFVDRESERRAGLSLGQCRASDTSRYNSGGRCRVGPVVMFMSSVHRRQCSEVEKGRGQRGLKGDSGLIIHVLGNNQKSGG